MRGAMRWAVPFAALVAAAPLAGQTVVAVLPFENTGSYGQDKDNFEALELGLPAILAGVLAEHPDVRVADRAGVRGASDQLRLGDARRLDAGSASAVARAVGARYAVTGSFADFYGKFRINARLVDGRTGEILRVVSNDDPGLQDRAQLGAIVQLVAERIVSAAGLSPYPPAQAARQRAMPADALTDYSRGLLFERRGDPSRAAQAFERALTTYPGYPQAKDGLQRVRGS